MAGAIGKAALAGALVVAAASAASAQGRVSADYSVTFLGLSIGQGSMVSTTDGQTYRTTLNARVSGVASLFSSGSGTLVSTGRVTETSVVPANFTAEIRTRGQVETTQIAIAGGNVRSHSRNPAKPFGPNDVPVTPDHLRGITDPLSAGIFVAAGDGPVTGAAACNRRSRIFNGRERFDLVYSFVATREVQIAGYKGEAAICSVRFEPVAGYRRDRPDLAAAAQRRAEVTLVPIKGTRTLLPARIQVPTGYGTGVATATRLELDPGLPTRRAAAD